MDADERARMRALAEKAANPELDHWQRTHALWELRAALSPPVVLGLLDAADRAERLEAVVITVRCNRCYACGHPQDDLIDETGKTFGVDCAALADPAPGGQDAEREGGA